MATPMPTAAASGSSSVAANVATNAIWAIRPARNNDMTSRGRNEPTAA